MLERTSNNGAVVDLKLPSAMILAYFDVSWILLHGIRRTAPFHHEDSLKDQLGRFSLVYKAPTEESVLNRRRWHRVLQIHCSQC